MPSVGYAVHDADVGERFDVVAAQAFRLTRSAAARAIEAGSITIAGKVESKKYKIAAGDVIDYVYEERLVSHCVGQPIPLDVRYEDKHLLVLSKQPDLVCHPCDDHPDGTLVNALIYRYGADGLCNVQGDNDRLGIVHRLDRDTSGLMLAARTDEAGGALMDDIHDRVVDRHYLTLVHGIVAHDTAMVDAPIARSPRDRKRMAVIDSASSREAITTFTVLERFDAGRWDDGYTLLDCKLFTGRTHQIRVHMNYIRHACVGDPVYGTGSEKAQLGLRRQFLHSYRLSFEHPIHGEALVFVDALPPVLSCALEQLSDRSRGRTEAGERLLAELARVRVR